MTLQPPPSPDHHEIFVALSEGLRGTIPGQLVDGLDHGDRLALVIEDSPA